MRKLLFLAACLISGAVSATPVTIDFEGQIGDSETKNITEFGAGQPVYTQAGFEIELFDTASAIYGKDVGPLAGLGYNYMDWAPTFLVPDQQATLRAVDGSVFDLVTMDFSASFGSAPETALTITGYLQGGGTVTKSVTGAPNAWTTVSFDSSWTDLDSVVFSDGGVAVAPAITNIQLTAVPIPAAVWLFGSALAGLGWLRRR